MRMWGQSKQHQNLTESPIGETGGDEFERAAGRVSADLPADPGAVPGPGEAGEGDSLTIRPEWAEQAARLCFFPAAKFVHPAYALADEEAAAITPQMQTFLQAVADKYAPAAVGRLANKYPEFFDLAAALGVLYWQKWRHVSHILRMEAQERAAREAAAGGAPAEVPGPVAVPIRAGGRDEEGRLVI